MGATRTRASIAADEVRAELARQRHTILWLSNTTGLKLRTLVRRLDGTSKFDLDELDAIARALGVPLAQLLNDPRLAVV